jgi:ubiquinone/menaquinone biosynthesis C-methylase UbiE
MDTPRAGSRQRIFAWALAHFNTRYEQFISKYKRQLFADVSGNVIEIGPGTGVNLRYLPNGVRWIGVDPNPFMQSYLREEAQKVGLPIEYRVGTADALPAADTSMDFVISTLVLCCVPSPKRCMQEILRVLKPGGKFLFIEHVAAPRGTRLRRIQNLITPVWKRLGDGCHPNRETWIDLESVGFGSVTHETITAPTPIVSPQIVGVAVRSSPTSSTSSFSTSQ